MFAETHIIIVASNTKDTRNTHSHFYNTLSQPLDLSEGRWKVGVKKIIYFNAFRNIVNESVTVRRHKSDGLHASLLVSEAPAESTLLPFKARVLPANGQYSIKLSKHRDGGYYYDTFSVHINTDPSKPKIEWTKFDVWGLDDSFPPEGTVLVSRTKTADFPLRYEETITLNSYHASEEISSVISYDATDTYSIPPGEYHSIVALLKGIPKVLGVKYKVEGNNRVRIAINKKYVEHVTFNNDLHLILGFKKKTITAPGTIADNAPQLNRGRFAFFIYSNIVGNQAVGDMQVPLLDVISISSRQNFGDIVSLDVCNPIYRDVIVKNVSEVEIKITSDSGELIAFDSADSKTLMVLQFIKI